MGRIGVLGSIVFRVSEDRVLTMSDMQRTVSGTWSQYEVIGGKPTAVFQGAALQEISFKIVLDAALGVSPYHMLTQIERMVESGETNILIIGKKRIGKGRWRITKSSEAWKRILSGGELKRAEVSLTLQEYW